MHACIHVCHIWAPWWGATLYLHLCVSCRVDTEEWMATVEVLLSKSSEACQWMVQYLVGPEGREIVRWVLSGQRSCHIMFFVTNLKHYKDESLNVHLCRIGLSTFVWWYFNAAWIAEMTEDSCVSFLHLPSVCGCFSRGSAGFDQCSIFVAVPVICDTSDSAAPSAARPFWSMNIQPSYQGQIIPSWLFCYNH